MGRFRITAGFIGALTLAACASEDTGRSSTGQQLPPDEAAQEFLAEGREIFRYDTFGSEQFFGGTLALHRAIAGEANGGVGAGVPPSAALGLGLKVDMEKLPAELVSAVQAGEVDLEDPATTLALLQLDSVVGVRGFFDDAGTLTTVGVTCAICHSTVDDAFAPGIGRRLDGWPNRDLNVGAIVASAPDLSYYTNALGVDDATVRQVLTSWGPGKYDALLLNDGKAFKPDGSSSSVVLPPAFGLAGVNLATYTGWGDVTYWNAYVANTQMHGQGTFYDPRLMDAARFPVAAALGSGNLRSENDRITGKLPALHVYQLSLKAPTPPEGSFDAAAAERGRAVFDGEARCAECHVPPLYTEPGHNLHAPADIGIDDFHASRSPTGMYRTTPLKGLFARAKGGYYHDGRFADLGAVVDHYDGVLGLGLAATAKADLVEYLKSL